MLNFAFLTLSLSTISIDFFKSTGTVFNLPRSRSFTFVFQLLKLVGTLVSLLMSNMSSSAFKTIKSFLTAKSDVSTPVSWSNFFLVANF